MATSAAQLTSTCLLLMPVAVQEVAISESESMASPSEASQRGVQQQAHSTQHPVAAGAHMKTVTSTMLKAIKTMQDLQDSTARPHVDCLTDTDRECMLCSMSQVAWSPQHSLRAAMGMAATQHPPASSSSMAACRAARWLHLGLQPHNHKVRWPYDQQRTTNSLQPGKATRSLPRNQVWKCCLQKRLVSKTSAHTAGGKAAQLW